MLPCLHTQGTFTAPAVAGAARCSVCSIPFMLSPRGQGEDGQEPSSKRHHVNPEPEDFLGPPVGPPRPMFAPAPPAMRGTTAAAGPAALSSVTSAEELQLLSMGFELRDVREALRRTGSVEAAVMALVGETAAPAVPPAPLPAPPASTGGGGGGGTALYHKSTLLSSSLGQRSFARHRPYRTYDIGDLDSEWEELMESVSEAEEIRAIVAEWRDSLGEAVNDVGTVLHNAVFKQRVEWVEELVSASNDDHNDPEMYATELTPLALACKCALETVADSEERQTAERIILILLDGDLQNAEPRPVDQMLGELLEDKDRLRKQSRQASAMRKRYRDAMADLERLRRDLQEAELKIEELQERERREVRVELADEEVEEEEEEEEGQEREGEGAAAAAAAAVTAQGVKAVPLQQAQQQPPPPPPLLRSQEEEARQQQQQEGVGV